MHRELKVLLIEQGLKIERSDSYPNFARTLSPNLADCTDDMYVVVSIKETASWEIVTGKLSIAKNDIPMVWFQEFGENVLVVVMDNPIYVE